MQLSIFDNHIRTVASEFDANVNIALTGFDGIKITFAYLFCAIIRETLANINYWFQGETMLFQKVEIIVHLIRCNTRIENPDEDISDEDG